MINKKGFASDNNSGVHPEIMMAISEANRGHAVAYGDDPYTREAQKKFQEEFGPDVSVYFVFLGTAANVLGLGALARPYYSVVCPETAHINEDECGAPERFNGFKLIPVPTENGKLTIEGIQQHLHGINFEHHSQPRLISISQVTELGTIYTPEELKTLCDFAHEHNMYVHMDGARIANAAAALGTSFKEITKDVGIDVLSFGGTKNGMMYGEAIVFFTNIMGEDFKYMRKQGMQLASKMRFISAQFSAYFSNNLWYKTATHANEMARLLAEKASKIEGVTITQTVKANGVFAQIPREIVEPLQEEFYFYIWDDEQSVVRWMTSFDTTEHEIEEFVELIRKKVSAHN